MAQLIKLQDYISRYELDIYRYPSQYIRLKREKWEKLYTSWEAGIDEEKIEVEQDPQQTKSSWTKLLPFRKKNHAVQTNIAQSKPLLVKKTEEELRHYFLDQLFPFQLKWATSSISRVSFMDKKYNHDADLSYFLKRFPDNYFLMYYPVFNIKNAPVDAEIVLISPVQIEIIYILNENHDANIIVTDDRTWTIEKSNNESKVLSPIHALKRTEHVIKSILNKSNLTFPIQKTVLAKNNFAIFQQEPYQINVIGKHEYDDWFNKRRSLDSPLKSIQLKVADQLLKYCLTSSVKRTEWEEDKDEFTTVGGE